MFFIILAISMIINRCIPETLILAHPKRYLTLGIAWLLLWEIVFILMNQSIFMIVALLYSLIGLYIQDYLIIFARRNKQAMIIGTSLLGGMLILLIATMFAFLYW